jgi:hypothetical protein
MENNVMTSAIINLESRALSWNGHTEQMNDMCCAGGPYERRGRSIQKKKKKVFLKVDIVSELTARNRGLLE